MAASIERWANNADRAHGPITAHTSTHHEFTPPIAFDFVKLIFVRKGSAILFSEFGQHPVALGDVAVLARNTLCGGEPEGHVTVTTLYLDPDYLVDQVFWQYASVLSDRLHAQQFVETFYAEPAQLMRLGESRAGMLMPWLDELVALTIEDRPMENFNRVQALWFSVAHVLAPFVKTTPIRKSSTQRATTLPAQPRLRQPAPLRTEARDAAELLRKNPERRWSVGDLATEVHLSKSQLGRVFVEAYGKTPIAYLAMLRTELMAGLLRTTDTPIAIIAREAGWSDADFAARQFRRSVGLTPSRYRAMTRQQTQVRSG